MTRSPTSPDADGLEDERADGDGTFRLEGSDRHGPRNYNLIGPYARIWIWSLGAMALAFGVFLLLRLL